MKTRMVLSILFISAMLLGALLWAKPSHLTIPPSPGTIARTGDTVEARFDHTATLLSDGKVLIAAGMERNGKIQPTAELYDPASGRFGSVGKLRSPRGWGATATRLTDGTVLIAAGASASLCGESCYLPTAELYDPATNTFVLTKNMTQARAGAASILMPDGDVLIVGGNESGPATAELYHPSTKTFSPTGSMHSGGAARLLLPKDGKVLALNDSGGEVYDPATRTFTPAGSWTDRRAKFGAGLLPDGRALVAGGQFSGAWGARTNRTEIYNPSLSTFTPGPQMASERFKLGQAVVALRDGRILIAGGAPRPEIYDPSSNSLVAAAGMQLDSYYFSTATLLSDGEVLIVGGYARGGGSATSHSWLFRP